MRTYLECFPCMMTQALRAGRATGLKDEQIKILLDQVGMMIRDIPMGSTPPESGRLIYEKVREITGREDPYEHQKADHIREALALYPEIKGIVESADDPLLTSIRFAIAGNVIDLGVDRHFDLPEEIRHALEQKPGIFHYHSFVEVLKRASSILYLGDNAGESVFDRILIETLDRAVRFVVRDIPIINDVTRKDAVMSGLGEVAEIVSSGTTAPGTVLSLCTDEFLEIFNHANMIISKGQGNYEALSETQRPVFFLLKAKCPVIAHHLGVKEDDIVLKYSNFESQAEAATA